MPFFYNSDDLHPEVKPLSVRERNWLIQLERHLLKCPSQRLHLATIGDAALTAFDNAVRHVHDIRIEDGGASENRIALAEISSKPQIHGISG